MPSTLHLTVTVADTTYVLGTLSFNTVKKELSYHFTYPEDAPSTHLNYDSGEYTARLEHITWHQNIAHIKRGDNIPIERIKLNQSPLFCSTPVITPLYLESLYFKSANPCLKESSSFRAWKGSQNQEILKLNHSEEFSVLFILIPSSINTADILLGMQFLETPARLDYPPSLVDLCDENHRTGRILLWGGWDFLILTSPYKCRIRSPVPPALGESYRLPNYKNVPAGITDLIMQANNLIKVGKNL